jgi:hypothetical protein
MSIIHMIQKGDSTGCFSHHVLSPSKPKKKIPKTYNSTYSPVVTHLTTNAPVEGLTCGEQTGSGVILRLWSYVSIIVEVTAYIGSLDADKRTLPIEITTSTILSQQASNLLRHQQVHTNLRFLPRRCRQWQL